MSEVKKISVKALSVFIAPIRARKLKGKETTYKVFYIPLHHAQAEALTVKENDVVELAIIDIRRST